MATIGLHCSHEQHPPSRLLQSIRQAEQHGFQAGMCSDHFAPWSLDQGQSGFAWSWLGAALQATSFDLGVVTAPVQRYHPAIIAQAAATLSEMFPDRFWLAVGSGEALNEQITGDPWPAKAARKARLKEAVEIIRALFTGERVTHDGMLKVREAKLYTLPERPPRMIGAAVSAETAEWIGSWADGMITVSRPHPEMKEVVNAFRRGGGDGKPMFLQVPLSYGRTKEEAERRAFEWRTNVIPSSDFKADVPLPEYFDAAAEFIRVEDLYGPIRISADLDRHIQWIEEDIALGFDRIYLHHVGLEQDEFIKAFGKHVLPKYR